MTANPFEFALSHVSAPVGRALWLYGEPGIASGDAYHPWKDQADALLRAGCNVISDLSEAAPGYDAVFVNSPKQQDQAEGLLAFALERSRGFVMVSARGDAGGSRLRAMMEAYGVNVEHLSKSRSQVAWTLQAETAHAARIAENLKHLAPRRVLMEGGEWWSVPGLFGWDKIDPGSRLLMEHLPADLSGSIADFGCGYGYLSVMAARRYPALEAVDAYDADSRAVACCASNGEGRVNALWQDIRALVPEHRYDAVIMNPPFHAGKNEDLALGRAFIEKAWVSLKPRGRLFMVANRHLPYEKVVPGLSIVFEGEGYKVLSGRAA